MTADIRLVLVWEQSQKLTPGPVGALSTQPYVTALYEAMMKPKTGI